MKKIQVTPRLSGEAVHARTGRTWREWFSILDSAGARKMDHKDIVAYLRRNYRRLGGWWKQMVAVSYEQARGLREKYERTTGFEISVSRTMTIPVAGLYKAWRDERTRRRWLPAKHIMIRKATANKSIRFAWADRQGSVEVNFYPRGKTKSQVVIQHGKLSDASAAARMKAYWTKTLHRLRRILESSQL